MAALSRARGSHGEGDIIVHGETARHGSRATALDKGLGAQFAGPSRIPGDDRRHDASRENVIFGMPYR